MKTTLDIQDHLMERARQLARTSGRSMRSLVEEGLRRVLEEGERSESYQLPDLSVGDPADSNPLEGLSWQEIRSEIYGEKRVD